MNHVYIWGFLAGLGMGEYGLEEACPPIQGQSWKIRIRKRGRKGLMTAHGSHDGRVLVCACSHEVEDQGFHVRERPSHLQSID